MISVWYESGYEGTLAPKKKSYVRFCSDRTWTKHLKTFPRKYPGKGKNLVD